MYPFISCPDLLCGEPSSYPSSTRNLLCGVKGMKRTTCLIVPRSKNETSMLPSVPL
jgi:hypothetical protein